MHWVVAPVLVALQAVRPLGVGVGRRVARLREDRAHRERSIHLRGLADAALAVHQGDPLAVVLERGQPRPVDLRTRTMVEPLHRGLAYETAELFLEHELVLISCVEECVRFGHLERAVSFTLGLIGGSDDSGLDHA